MLIFKPADDITTCSRTTRIDDPQTCRTDDLSPDLKDSEKALMMSSICSYCTYPNMMSGSNCQYCPGGSDTRPCSLGAPSSTPRSSPPECHANVSECDDFATYSCMASHKKCSSCVLSGCVFQVTKVSKDKNNEQMSCIDPASLPDTPNTTELTSDGYTVFHYSDTEKCALSNNVDLFECGTFDECTECTKHHNNCMWCGSLNVCVSNEAYVTSFPFGQCFEWFQRQNCQRTKCEGHLTCKTCQSDPRCGWCDDGTMTGSGKCMEGTLDMDNEKTCTATSDVKRWYWVNCPSCNCSGHSKCDAETNECIDCQSNTYGKNCERCLVSFLRFFLKK